MLGVMLNMDSFFQKLAEKSLISEKSASKVQVKKRRKPPNLLIYS